MVMFHVEAKKQPDEKEQGRVNEFFISPAQWEGRYPPDFELELLDGSTFRLSEEIGRKLIVLNFFATWCGPCRQEMPELVAYQRANRDEPFLLLGIDIKEDQEKVQKFLDEFKVTYTAGIDRDGTLEKQYAIRGFPTTVVIGVDGRVKAYIIGPVANANVAFDPHLAEAREALASSEAITAEAYRDALDGQDPLAEDEDEDDDEPRDELTGRAREIAEAMLCPCGCSDQVIDCTCGTAKKIKKRLKAMNLEGRTNEEVIRELNAEFCVGDG